MKLRLYLILPFLFYCLKGFSYRHNYKADSLKTLIAKPLESSKNITDTAVINKINKLANEIFESSPDSTLYYGNLAVKNSRNLNYNKGLADGLLQIGHVNYFKGNYSKASQDLAEAVSLYKKEGNDKGLSRCYLSYARMYNLLSDNALALNYANQALTISQNIKDEQTTADSYVTLGIIYDSKGQLPKALDNYFKSITINLNLHNEGGAASGYNNIGVILQTMEIYPKALEYYTMASDIWLKVNDQQGVGTSYENIGEILLWQKKYNEALTYFFKSLKIALKHDDSDGISSLYKDIGLCYAHQNQFDKAITYLDKALKASVDYRIDYNIAQALIGFATVYNDQNKFSTAYDYALHAQELTSKLGNLSARADAALQLSKALAGLKKYDEAYQMQRAYIDLKDSVKDEESIQKLTSYRLESNFADKQKQIDQQQSEKEALYQQKIEKQRLVNAIFLIIIICMIFIIGIYYRNRTKQKRINRILEEKNRKVLQQKTDIDEQANKLNDLNTLKDRLISILAHDLRAPLSTLRGLFNLLTDKNITYEQFQDMLPQVQKRLEYTSDFLDTLLFWINSQMENFEASAKSFNVRELVSLEIEDHNEQAGKKGIELTNRVPYELIASADVNSIRIVIRNLITNAIKFSGSNDVIKISAYQQDETNVLITVKDTGVGMSADQLDKLFKSKVTSATGTNNESGTGMGLLFCKDLVKKCNGKIWVNSKPGKGTEFSIILPVGEAVSKQQQQLEFV